MDHSQNQVESATHQEEMTPIFQIEPEQTSQANVVEPTQHHSKQTPLTPTLEGHVTNPPAQTQINEEVVEQLPEQPVHQDLSTVTQQDALTSN